MDVQTVKIKQWLMLLASAVILTLAALGLDAWLSHKDTLQRIHQSDELVRQNQTLNQIQLWVTQLVLVAMDNLVDKDEGQVQPERKQEADQLVSNIQRQLASLPQAEQQSLRPKFERLSQTITQTLPKLIEQRADEAQMAQLDDDIDAAGSTLADNLDTLINQYQQRFEAGQAALSAHQGERTQRSIALQLLLGVLLCGALWWITRAIYKPLGAEPRELMTLVERIGHGDLAQRIQASDNQSVLAGVDVMQQELRAVVHNIRQLAQTLGAQAVTQGDRVKELHSRAGTMATLVSEIVDNIALTDKSREEVREGNTRVVALANSAQVQAEGSIKRLGGVTRAVEDLAGGIHTASAKVNALGEQTETISTLVTGIRDIAEQTNLLALNAAIEAARAGEQGRGFAVVADEVRQLAVRAAQTTQDIVQAIGAIRDKTREVVDEMGANVSLTQRGLDEIQDTASSVGQIVDSCQEVAQAVSELMEKMSVQTQQTQAVVDYVHQIDHHASENGQSFEIASKEAEQLGEQASALTGMVNRFKTQAS
ncbi:methyl-accepting chemotaxis protein [Shewanella khirikhana]|uniref:Biofilm dispersion protein BdlA n=1 Tax=Shewanella khirikhana TaxID=1965282 RepID=A0ABM7DS92_9GAMM|nr:methyl-accepting chemotaxis protein [Shewanella khirikhana]AZQ12574.1 Biofilm dispersion protein BdlA [Shewanella khirikhana]